MRIFNVVAAKPSLKLGVWSAQGAVVVLRAGNDAASTRLTPIVQSAMPRTACVAGGARSALNSDTRRSPHLVCAATPTKTPCEAFLRVSVWEDRKNRGCGGSVSNHELATLDS